jgi:predicted nucleotidyltransferase
MSENGLNKRQLQEMRNIIRSNTKSVEAVHLFGARATNTYKNYSDIDLVLFGEIEDSVISRLWTCFYESNIPYKVDIAAYNLIRYLPLKKHIKNCSQILFSQKELYL